MTDVEMLIREQLSGLDPLPPALSANWDDVLSRVRQPASAGRERLRARPRRLAFAVVVAAIGFTVASLATPLGAAISRGLGDFSAWIAGSPGTPASPEDQQAFEQENERDWTYFPAGTQLRQLIQTETAGMTFKLFGFRSGDSLCLRLVAWSWTDVKAEAPDRPARRSRRWSRPGSPHSLLRPMTDSARSGSLRRTDIRPRWHRPPSASPRMGSKM